MSDEGNKQPGHSTTAVSMTGAKGGKTQTRVAIVSLVVMVIAVILALSFYRDREEADSEVQLSHQYIITALLKPTKEKLDVAAEQVRQLNYGNADVMLRQTVGMFQTAAPALGKLGVPQVIERISKSLSDAETAVSKMSPDALHKVQVATRQVELAEIATAQNGIALAKDEARHRRFDTAQAFLAQTATMFEDATKVEGMESTDWKDEVINSLAQAQKSLNGFADTAVKSLDDLGQEFQKVRLAKGQELLTSAKQQISTGDYTQAKESLEDFATMFERANQVKGMPRQDWVDDAVVALGKAQKSVNDFAEKTTPIIDRVTKTIGDKLAGK